MQVIITSKNDHRAFTIVAPFPALVGVGEFVL